jgi:hypothetical protein
MRRRAHGRCDAAESRRTFAVVPAAVGGAGRLRGDRRLGAGSPDGSRVAWFKDPDGNILSVAQTAY